MTKSLWLILCLTLAATAAPLLPDHLPVGAKRPLEAGESFTLAATRVFLRPSFQDSSLILKQDRKARVLGVERGFYQLELAPVDGAAERRVWVYRSELEVKGAMTGQSSAQVPGDLARGRATHAPGAGDTLSLQEPLLYASQDLLGEHQVLAGRQLLTVLKGESPRGFLEVKSADGKRGWLHRAELSEERRKAR